MHRPKPSFGPPQVICLAWCALSLLSCRPGPSGDAPASHPPSAASPGKPHPVRSAPPRDKGRAAPPPSAGQALAHRLPPSADQALAHRPPPSIPSVVASPASRSSEPSPPAAAAPMSEAEIEALLQAAQQGNPEDLLAVIDEQNQADRPWESPPPGPRLSGQGPTSELDYDETVQSALYQAYAIEPDSKAVGRPNHGHLQNGEPLPSNPGLYTIRRRQAAYASSHTALQVVTAFRNFRAQTGYKGEIIIADVSPKGGGRYRTHHSHQTGRDLDILMPLMPGTHQWGKNIDWDTTWALVRSFLETKEVEYVFLDYNIQKHLHAAALRAGEHPEKLKSLISWPVGQWNKTIIRDSPGHWAHVHVRVKCGPTETRCRSYH